MTKLVVLQIFARSRRFMKPDEVWHQLSRRLDRWSLYSYLNRLKKQGLVERNPNPGRGQLAYRLTERGAETEKAIQEASES
ncbi:MAG: winged helix-turn-helix transcriptional regulator [Acidobacteriia bacterium]|nr:winged helix-turn-helix transcriptional regulator [Terriglobia bacterium]